MFFICCITKLNSSAKLSMYLQEIGRVGLQFFRIFNEMEWFLQSLVSKFTRAKGISPTGKSPPSWVVNCPKIMKRSAGKHMTNIVTLKYEQQDKIHSLRFTYFTVVKERPPITSLYSRPVSFCPVHTLY